MTQKLNISGEKDDREKTQKIPAKGSLGLLAYGAQGILAWREARLKNAEKILKKIN
jgi:hypothetical protein